MPALSSSLQSLLCRELSRALGRPFSIEQAKPLSGGSINQALLLASPSDRAFVKINDADTLPLFEVEAKALEEIASERAVRVPRPLASGSDGTQSFLALEYIATGQPTAAGWQQLGEGLAQLHRAEKPYFGWARDNCIGSTPQPNGRSDDWIAFYREKRLAHQLRLCQSRGFSLRGADELLSRMDALFADHRPWPSLLHGDLWSGNVSFDQEGMPFLYDPCSYYGDRETDLAFSEFFGGFDSLFLQAYRATLPLDSGYALRRDLYNLYHCLNHYYIFGGHYAGQAQSMADGLLAQL